MSPAAASRTWLAIFLAFSIITSEACFSAEPPIVIDARAVGAAAEADLIGVALDHADGVEVDAEPFHQHLGVDGLVALAVVVGARRRW